MKITEQLLCPGHYARHCADSAAYPFRVYRLGREARQGNTATVIRRATETEVAWGTLVARARDMKPRLL